MEFPRAHPAPCSRPRRRGAASSTTAAGRRGAPRRVLRVLGAPGTGKTTTAVEAGRRPGPAATGRRPTGACCWPRPGVAAARLRERVTARLGGTSTEPLARTHQAFGFGILRAGGGPARRPAAAAAQRPRAGRHPARAARRARGGRGARRRRGPSDVHARAAHPRLPRRAARPADAGRRARPRARGPRPRSAREHDRPEWVGGRAGAARVRRGHRVLAGPGAYDPAWILGAAADLLEDDPDGARRGCAARCGSSSSTTPRSSPRRRPGCCGCVARRRRRRPRAPRRPRRRRPDLPRRRPAAARLTAWTGLGDATRRREPLTVAAHRVPAADRRCATVSRTG